MTRRRSAAFALAFALSFGAGSAARAEVRFRTGALEPVLAEARSSQRAVLLDFWASWCGPCLQMDATVWPRADVTTAAEHDWVALRVDADTPEGAALRERFHVGSLPAVLALRADGTEIDRLTGFSNGDTVLASLRGWRSGQDSLATLEAQSLRAPEDLALHARVGTLWADRADETHARAHLQRVIEGDANNARGLAAEALLALGDRLYLRAMRDPGRAEAPLRTLVDRYTSTISGARGAVPLATALHRLHRDDEARSVLTRYLDAAQGAERPQRANSAAWMLFRENFDLERAEQIARRGLESAQYDHALLDTLAEVLNARGRSREALEVEERAARVDPHNAHYRQQIERFRAAASATPSSGARPSAAPSARPSARPSAARSVRPRAR